MGGELELLTGALASERIMLWVAVDPSADGAGVLARSGKLALMSPFKSEEDALAALGAAGCIGL